MGIVVRQSIKATVVSYLGALVGYINIMFITPLCLSPEIIGFGKVFLDAALMFTFVAQLGLNSALIRFFPYFRDEKNNHGIFGIILVVPLMGLVLLSALVGIFYNPIIGMFQANSALFADNFYYVLPLTFFMMYLVLFETFSSCLLRIVVPKLIREIGLRLLNIAVIVLFYLKVLDFKAYIISIIVIYVIATVLNLYYLKKITNLSIKPDFSGIPKKVFRDLMFYIAFILFVGIGSNIVSKIDVFMISSSLNLSYAGIFSIAFYVTTIIEIPSKAFMQITNPIVAQAAKDNDFKKIGDLYTKSSINQYIVGGFILLLVWANVDNIFKIMPNGELFQSGKYVILLLGLGKIADMVTGINLIVIANSRYYWYQLIFTSYITATTILLNYYLIPRFGINGAGMTSLIAMSTYNLLLLFFLKYKLSLWPFNIKTLTLTIFFLLLFAINYILPVLSNPILDGIYRSIILTAGFVLVIYKGNISDDFNNLISQISLENIKKHIPTKIK
ncbi:MAG TPA: hypothetical protein PK252_10630 [Bacteroidales bacterium]|nr:hypothetical protein [Bacteroidales bacterium]